MGHPRGDGYAVSPEALDAYSSSVQGLSGQLSALGGAGLASTADVGPAGFSRLGQEVGLGAAFSRVARETGAGVTAAATGLDQLAAAVDTAGVGYTQQDEDEAASMTRAEQV